MTALRWRKEPPDEPGWWWVEERDDDASTLQRVMYLKANPFTGRPMTTGTDLWPKYALRWAGPIAEPKEPTP